MSLVQWVGYAVAVLCGVLLGWLVAAVLIRRAEPQREAPNARAELAARVVAKSSAGYVVTDHDGNVLLSNERARVLQVVRAGMLHDLVADAVQRTVVSSEPVDVELAGAANPAADEQSVIHAVAQPLTDELVLVSVSDESASRRVETIRRDFVANVSHELKTPVGAMGLLAEAVLDGSDDPESVRHFAAKMLTESTRLANLVNELIALSRLQGGLAVQDMAVVEIDAVVVEAIGRLATRAETAGIEVVADAPSGLLVRGDRTLLVTALANLIDNAISYSGTGTFVSITRARRDGFVEISVTDRGIGIAPEHQKRVFERFFRVDPARSRVTGGTGLGLAIVKHVAANHGGQATLWSRVGTGTTFTLRLPSLGSENTRDSSGPETTETALAASATRAEGAS